MPASLAAIDALRKAVEISLRQFVSPKLPAKAVEADKLLSAGERKQSLYDL